MKTQRRTTVIQLLLGACGLMAGACSDSNSQSPAGNDPCDNPDAPINCCFSNVPASPTHILKMGSAKEPGIPLLITGTLLRADGNTPYAGVLLYAYQTDNTGRYTKKGGETGVQKWHGHLHGWAKSDSHGRYEIRSIRPAPYPSRTIPAHIHAAIQEPGGRPPYYISDFVFADDPLVTPQYQALVPALGGTGIVAVRQKAAGGWVGQRNIVLKN